MHKGDDTQIRKPKNANLVFGLPLPGGLARGQAAKRAK